MSPPVDRIALGPHSQGRIAGYRIGGDPSAGSPAMSQPARLLARAVAASPGLSELPVPGQQRSRNPHGRSTFAMISANCVAGRDRGEGLPVLSARQFIGAATTALSLITGALLLVLAAGNARAQGSAPSCDAAGEIAVLPSPWAPWKGAPLRVMLVTDKPLQGELLLTGPG